VNDRLAEPLFPSAREALEIETVGAGSSSVIVPIACARVIVAFVGDVTFSEKVSFGSSVVSPTTATLTF
jgi:hypothetical protein